MLGQGLLSTTSQGCRRTGIGVVVILLALTLAACGGDDDGDDGNTIDVAHSYGSSRVPLDPERIVSLDTQWTDVLTALGTPPVAVGRDPNLDADSFPWQGDELADTTLLELGEAIPYEAIAEQNPQVIVATWVVEDEAIYDRLSNIAPTIPVIGDDVQVDSWQDMAGVAGRMLQAEDEAQALVADVEATVGGFAEQHPGLDGKTYALANYVAGDAIYVVADPDDGAAVVFADLGMGITPTVLDAADDVSGRVELSLEQTSMLDSDLLLILPNGADPAEMPGYDRLPAVQSDAVVVLGYADAVAFNTPTPLSIPYALDLIESAATAAEAAA
jgi:ABC-type Fe3+-hydroxamate transport system substrate-binding protein